MQALPPPLFFEDEQPFMFLLMISIYQTYLRKIRRQLPFHDNRMRSRILEDRNQDQLVLVDVYSTLVSRPYDFLRLSGETIQSSQDLQDLMAPRMVNFQHIAVEPRNRLLITLIWLRQYPTYPMLSLMFGIGTSTVGDIVNNMWLILWEICVTLVEWPDVNSWRQRIGEWPETPLVVGSIDGTSHEILIPSNEPQEEFYSGHRKYYCIHTQIIIDNRKNICYIHSGFLGDDNDAFTYQQMKPIGPGMELDFPDNCYILADSIYSNTALLVTPYETVELLRLQHMERRRKRKYKILHKKRRVYVEHVIKELNTFKVIGFLYRHPRSETAAIVELCAALSKRRADYLQI